MQRLLLLMTVIIAVPAITVAQQAENAKKKESPAKQQDKVDKELGAKGKPKKGKPEKKQPDPHAKDREAIIKTIASYVDAFNAADAKKLAQHWSIKGEWISRDTGERISGREAIQQQFAAMFTETENGRINISVDSIRFVADNVAIEEGVAVLTGPDGASDSTYTAIHVKEKGTWKIDSVRETVVPARQPGPSNYEHLKELEWMIGEWVDQAEDSTVETKCEWTKNGNFITRSFKASVQGEIELEGTQVIGWGPTSETIRSWVFDSDGGFGEGTWERKGDRWIVKASQVLPDGGLASSVNIFTYVDGNSFTWQSIGRQIDGEFQPNVEEVTIVRKLNNGQE